MKARAAEANRQNGKSIFSRKIYDAVLFDLDGVITSTEKIHCACWKKTFDEFFLARERETGEIFSPFDETEDYLRYVDGKPRHDGVRSFLLSRGIELPGGQSGSPPGESSIFGIGNRKNELFVKTLENRSVEIYETSISLARFLKEAGFRLAIVSSSRNCKAVMTTAGIEGLFSVIVDGVSAMEKGLRGKPEPDMFLEAARALGAKPERSVVIEDASVGVAAGAKGRFALVIGVARKNNETELISNGADIVVSDLGELRLGE